MTPLTPLTPLTSPNKRRFLSVDVRTLDNQSKEEHLDFDPSLLSTAELEKICRSIDTIKQQVFFEFARRSGILRRPAGMYIPPTVSNKVNGKQVKPLTRQDLADLAELL